MFNSAKIKLTFWYVLILMTVSILFSAVVYELLFREVERFALMQHTRQRHEVVFVPFSQYPFRVDLEEDDRELVTEARTNIRTTLLLVNLIILGLSSGLSYILAGRTLSPIQEMLDEQNRFISDASHELRTPLTAIKTSMEVFLRDKKSTLDEARDLIKTSIEDVDNLKNLSDSLIQSAQYTKPHSAFTTEAVSLGAVLSEVARKLQPVASSREITINVKSEENCVIGNKYGLIELFTILLDNAIKYSRTKGNVSVIAYPQNRIVVANVIDTGIGIPKGDLPHVYDRFYRSDKSRTQSLASGHGLGLSIAKDIVSLHKGTISIKSDENIGTTVTVTLPSA